MFWDRAAGIYDLFANVWNKKTHGALCAYVEAQISPADEVLECACGTGLLTEGIAAKCKRLVATDFSEKMLEKAEKKCGKFGNVTFKRENILQIGEPDGRFDAVVAANV
ncbi:MAG: class I SAM-dependent methyltransferase, partial [Christensenellales bacterium]